MKTNHQDTKAPREPISAETDRVATQVVDAAFRVYSHLGPGLLESVYETCLVHELRKKGLKVARQVVLPIRYDGLCLDDGLRLDVVVEDQIVIEVKAVESLLPVHRAQLLTCLKLSGHRLGFLINFNVDLFRAGVKRVAL